MCAKNQQVLYVYFHEKDFFIQIALLFCDWFFTTPRRKFSNRPGGKDKRTWRLCGMRTYMRKAIRLPCGWKCNCVRTIVSFGVTTLLSYTLFLCLPSAPSSAAHELGPAENKSIWKRRTLCDVSFFLPWNHKETKLPASGDFISVLLYTFWQWKWLAWMLLCSVRYAARCDRKHGLGFRQWRRIINLTNSRFSPSCV